MNIVAAISANTLNNQIKMNKWQFSIKKGKKKKKVKNYKLQKNVNELRVTIIKILFVRFSFKCYRLDDHICIIFE